MVYVVAVKRELQCTPNIVHGWQIVEILQILSITEAARSHECLRHVTEYVRAGVAVVTLTERIVAGKSYSAIQFLFHL